MKSIFFSALVLFAPVAATAQTNYSLSFDGTNDFVNIGTTASNGIRSIECWFKPAVTYNDQITEPATLIFRNTGQNEVGECGIFISPWPGEAGHIVFQSNVNGTRYHVISNASEWIAGNWYHVAGVIHPSLGMKLYIDGDLQSSSNTWTQATQIRTESTCIGRWGDLDDRYFNGEMDELRLWSRAISQAEIQQKMCVVLHPANESGLATYYKTNEGSGTTLTDATTGGINGNISEAIYVPATNCVNGTLSISESKEMTFKLFPNPANQTVNIHPNENFTGGNVQIITIYGQTVLSPIALNSPVFQFSVQDLPAGTYFIQLLKDDTVVASERLIIE